MLIARGRRKPEELKKPAARKPHEVAKRTGRA
jgi:hypothetical protein